MSPLNDAEAGFHPQWLNSRSWVWELPNVAVLAGVWIAHAALDVSQWVTVPIGAALVMVIDARARRVARNS